MVSYYDIAGVKIRYNSIANITAEAVRTFEVPPFGEEESDLYTIEYRHGQLLIPSDFEMTYEQPGDLNCFVSPSGEIIIQAGLEHITERRDGSFRARLNADMSFAEADYTPFLNYNPLYGRFGRFIYECHVMNRGWLPMHAVSVGTGDGAILFSGVSGAGKSTLAELWIKYAGSRIINGDRAVLIPEDGGYVTAGTAWSGSSEIYTKLREKVKAIIFIEQAKENTIERLKPQKSFDNIIKHCPMPYYHSGLMNKVMDTLDNLTGTVPMFYLKNRADEECYEITRSAIFER